MYSILNYAGMVANKVRMDAYAQALAQTVKPGAVVLDIGTGTGICALLACRFGAARVYAIEPNPAIQAAQEIASANDYADRITFIQELSTNISLPERADVIVSDLRGVLPLFCHHLPSIIDARQRFLAPGGTLIPQSDRLWVTLVNATDLYQKYVEPWNGNTYDFTMSPTERYFVNNYHKERLTPEQVLVEPQCWATLDYTTIASPHVCGQSAWTVEQAATAHGLLLWFDATVAPGVEYSNAPSAPELVYQSAFFPLQKPLALTTGDKIKVNLQANLIGDDYVWRWETCVFDQTEQQQPKHLYKQTTFFGQPLTGTLLKKRELRHIPRINQRGQADSFILNAMNGENSVQEIAHQALQQFAGHFKNSQEATERVRLLSEYYSQS